MTKNLTPTVPRFRVMQQTPFGWLMVDGLSDKFWAIKKADSLRADGAIIRVLDGTLDSGKDIVG